MNAAERFFVAARSHDLPAATAELADGVVLHNPVADRAATGSDEVARTLAAVQSACDEFRHTRMLAADDSRLVGLLFEAAIGDETLHGVDLLELDEHDRIVSFTIMARPMSVLMALGARMTQ